MPKIILLSLLAFFFFNMAYAQKSFNLTIKLDSSINPTKVKYQYYDGKNTTFLPDTFGSKRVVVLKSEYYSPLASFHITYTDSAKAYYENDFFINDKPAVINFYFKANDKNKLNYSLIENATPIYDSTVNKTWGRFTAFMGDTAFAKENKAFDTFWEQNKTILWKSDSLKQVFSKFYKSRINRNMLFFKKYPNDYFSFWYFRQYVAQPNGVLGKDTAYLKEQLAYLKAVFPAKYTESIEGKELIKGYEAAIKPLLKLNETVPSFNLTTIDGKKISLSEFKGKYILLDFWATWCPPCLAEIPFIKEIRKNNSPDKLVIIGISADHDIKPLNAKIKNEGMNWLHFYDRTNEMSQLYGIDTFPTLILIDKNGKMIYKSDFKKNDRDALPPILEGLN